MSDCHEPWEQLASAFGDVHRALISVKEEIEAVDWYHQRACVATDEALARILRHNRDEEIEHACMTLEWLRRMMPEWDTQLKRYLFTTGEIVAESPLTKGHADAGAQSKAPLAETSGLKLGNLGGPLFGGSV